MVRKLLFLLVMLLSACSAGCRLGESYPIAGCGLVSQIDNSASVVEPGLLNMARRSPAELFEAGLRRCRSDIRDYRCRFICVERLGGTLTAEQHIDVRFLAEPFSVLFEWVKNAPQAQKLLYVEGQNDGNMLVVPTLLGWLTGPIEVDPHGSSARRNARRAITDFGFERMLGRMASPCRTGRLSDGGEFQDSFAGLVEVNGITALVVERRRLGAEPDDQSSPAAWRFCLDARYLVPIAVTEYGRGGIILGDYVFTDLRFNTGLKPGDFSPAAIGMKK